MAMRQSGNKTYRTMQGREIDMDMLRKKNELTPAVGNARVNARGDELGAGGKIVRKREDIVNDYYKNTRTVPEENTGKTAKEQPASEEKSKPKAEKSTARKTKSSKTEEVKEQTPSAEEAAEWEETEDGDFVKKGE
jgi:hypothetical protein